MCIRDSIYPGAPEIPDNGIDEDCDGVDSTTTSIHHIGATSIEIFPNPFDNYIILKSTDNQHFRIQIIDVNGKLIFDESRKGIQISIDLDHLISGIYFMQITHSKSNASETIKVLKP